MVIYFYDWHYTVYEKYPNCKACLRTAHGSGLDSRSIFSYMAIKPINEQVCAFGAYILNHTEKKADKKRQPV